MKRLISTFSATALLAFCFAATATAQFELENFDVTYTNKDGTPATQAGSHPYEMTTKIFPTPKAGYPEFPSGALKDINIDQIAGLVADTTAFPRCKTADFLLVDAFHSFSNCPNSTAVGVVTNNLQLPGITPSPIFNLEPGPGSVARLGFVVFIFGQIVVDIGVKSSGEYNGTANTNNISQMVAVKRTWFTLWGDPSDPSHDPLRGNCLSVTPPGEPPAYQSNGNCPGAVQSTPFLTLPRSCTGSAPTSYVADSWEEPGALLSDTTPDLSDPHWLRGSVLTHDNAEPPNPQGLTGCGKLGFNPAITAEPTTKAAQSPTGLDFSLDVNDEGLANPSGLAESDIRKTVVTLPEGMTANPSLAEGLGVCTEADLARETLASEPGAGCPNASKIGTVEVDSPLIEENVTGSLFIAEPYQNPFDSLLAMYVVIKSPKLGILVKQPLRVEPNPVTGQLTTVAEDMPQLPFSHFKLHFREGARSPLSSPPTCGNHDVKAVLYPWAGGEPITTTSTFEIISGANNSPCPKGGLPPFKPGLLAGTISNAAGRFSPFNLRMSREDGEQEITHFSIKLPPGITGKLAGVPSCSDAAIAAATARTGPLGGHEELANPSCPAASQIGRTLAGSGVGPALTYAPGKIYLAGPYHGAPLSMVAITSGVVGPFDIGTVVVREAFKIDPETAEVFVDATGSDPIPHIIEGIPVHLREIRAYVDKPEFVLNPTDCDRTSTASTVLGSGFDFGSEADDNPVTVTSPFQAADCASLPFSPRLDLRLLGGTRRGAHPAFKATLRMNGIGEAAIQRAQVTLPHSEFLENAHIKTICTRVQFKAGAGNGAQCPAGSVYGHAKAVTPLLDGTLEGPVFLRSSEHQLPDLVVALHSPTGIDFALVGRVDSVKGGGIRNTFEAAPDAPVSSFTLTMQGGKKGLLVNSTNLCKGTHRALVDFQAHSGKQKVFRPALKAKCGGKAKKKRAQRRNAR
jgi:hypothetical protein